MRIFIITLVLWSCPAYAETALERFLGKPLSEAGIVYQFNSSNEDTSVTIVSAKKPGGGSLYTVELHNVLKSKPNGTKFIFYVEPVTSKRAARPEVYEPRLVAKDIYQAESPLAGDEVMNVGIRFVGPNETYTPEFSPLPIEKIIGMKKEQAILLIDKDRFTLLANGRSGGGVIYTAWISGISNRLKSGDRLKLAIDYGNEYKGELLEMRPVADDVFQCDTRFDQSKMKNLSVGLYGADGKPIE